jgi:predicted AlkP superfamily pyrophosphatase or phosphodiesterase
MLIHFVDLDSQRHYHGFSSKEATAAIHRHDRRLGKMIQALKESGIYENSTIIVLGDHSALDESKAVKLNVLLQEKGLIETDRRGRVTNWKAYCKSCDGSAYIYVNDPSDFKTKEVVGGLLKNLLLDEANGVERVFTQEEAAEMGADDQCAFMVEARLGFYLKENLDGSFIDHITDRDVRDKRYTVASHGYSPEKDNYHTIFMASGKGIRANTIIPSMNLVDEGPTFARLLGLNLGDTDGRAVEEIIAYSAK